LHGRSIAVTSSGGGLMKSFRGFMALVGLLFAGTHLVRHTYVLWIEPRTSVLDAFSEAKMVAGPEKSLEELLAAYKQAHDEVETEKKRAGGSAEENEYRRFQEKPWSTERELQAAIRERERHARELIELHFFWWSGFVAILIGAALSNRRPWLGFSFCMLGFLEMAWATFPAISRFGWAVELRDLLTLKVAYSAAMLVLLVVGWLKVERKAEPVTK
jgi:hypothetical protein